MANLDDILIANPVAFEGLSIKDHYSTISTKLSELGYDVLINEKAKNEYIPSSALNDVTIQRDNFKVQVETLNGQLLALKKDSKGDEAQQAKIQTLIDSNNDLMKKLDLSNLHNEIMATAKSAHNPKAIIPFIDESAIKKDDSGKFTGINEEVTRLMKEMPFLFNISGSAGMDGQGGGSTGSTGDMNQMIRKHAGRV